MRRQVDSRIAVLAAYAAISFAYFGIRLLPHPGRIIIGTTGQHDPDTFIWSFAWWPYAILHGLNPFFSHVVYAPTGVNLTWVTSVPALAVVFSPVTLLFGPSASYNVAAILLPAIAAWTAFLLCRYLTRSTWAALIGGYLYGFSSYVLAHQFGGHLNLTSVFLVPLVPLVLLRYLRDELTARGLAWRFGLIIALQVYISSEIAVTITLALAVGLILAFAFAASLRVRLVSSLVPLVGGYVLAGILAAPFIYYATTGMITTSIGYPWLFSADPINLVVPTRVIGWGGQTFLSTSSHFRGNDNERDSYLGIPLLLIAALALFRRPWTAGTRVLVAAFAIATFLSLGTALYIYGNRIAWLPWTPISHLSGFKNMIPSRFALYATLAIDVLAAMWIASTRGRFFARPYVLPLLAVAALVPPVWRGDYVQHPQRLAFFSDGLYKQCLPKNETLAIFPFARWGDSLLWQAETGFWFKMAEGALGPTNLPESFVEDQTIGSLLFYTVEGYTIPTMPQLLALAHRRHIDRFVSAAYLNNPYPSKEQMQAFGSPTLSGDVYVSPGCGQESLNAPGAP